MKRSARRVSGYVLLYGPLVGVYFVSQIIMRSVGMALGARIALSFSTALVLGLVWGIIAGGSGFLDRFLDG